MAMSEAGFKRRTFAEIVEDREQKAREVFGEDINTSENTPLGKFIRIIAYDDSLLSEEMEMIYYSIFPNTATGVSLDRLCVYVGISRNPATAARYQVTVAGTEGTIIPMDFLVGTESGVTFHNVNEVTIGADETATLLVDCTETGEIGNVQPDEITLITNPVAGVDEITSVVLEYKGEESESDYALRQRFEVARDGTGACNELAIVAAVTGVSTVKSASVIVNDSEIADSDGRPPHSFETYVSGGENNHQEIAEAIFSKKPIGIRTVGDISVDVTAANGDIYTVAFSHTSTINVYVKITVATTSEFEGADGKSEIIDNIESYIDGLGIGNSVVLSALYGEIHKVTGVKEVITLQLSTDNTTWGTANITAKSYENCVCAAVTVEVE